ncbi:MAG: glycosyl transferase family 1, partial [Bacteroidales bacterium]|nr:glycosyl transferase family 1 [Bacteroidales bacterium]
MKLLVLRFSALGDVMMSVPLLDALAHRYPEMEITVLSRRNFEAPFRFLPSNVRFWGVDLNLYKGLNGLNRLYREIRQRQFTHVADLHDVLRTRYLRMRCRMDGLSVAVIDKGRAGKRRLTRRRHKVLVPLTTGFERYRLVFERLGFPVDPVFQSLFADCPGGKPDISALRPLTGDKRNDRWIGIAPFAKHEGKIYPLERQRQVVDRLRRQAGCKVFIFG